MTDPDQFAKDFERLAAHIAMMAAKYDLNKPTILFHPEWKAPIFSTACFHHSNVNTMCGIPIQFGILNREQLITVRG